MTYQVLARKWRPQTFTEMVGQEHVTRALCNALDQNRLHHAYLFTGTRGVGKTTVARIFAKSLNCEKGISSHPCGVCSSCEEITQGRFFDLIEVDAASRTKVEDTRDLLENVQFAPNRGRYKVYIIDEVHMLSGHSFNALLKTLEEPPPHVKFLLATTDPQKLPVTVLSRCLQFHLKNMPAETIVTHLQNILAQENIHYETPGLWQLANAADGSMRDALSLLDQAIAYGNGQVIETDIYTMLGTLPTHQLVPLIDALISANPQQLMNIINELAAHGADFHQVLEELLRFLQQIAVTQQVPTAIDQNNSSKEKILAFAKQITAEDVQLYYQIAIMGRKDLPYAPSPKLGFEMILLRMLVFKPDNNHLTHTPNLTTTKTVINNAVKSTGESSATINKIHQSTAGSNTLIQPTAINSAITTHTMTQAASTHSATENNWATILSQLNLTGMTLALANNCSLEKIEESAVHLLLDPSHSALHNSRNDERLTQALQNYFNKPMKLQIRISTPNSATPAQQQHSAQLAKQAAAKNTIENDPGVQSIIKTFDAKIHPESIKALENTHNEIKD